MPCGPAHPELEKALEAAKTPADSAKLSFFPRAPLAFVDQYVGSLRR